MIDHLSTYATDYPATRAFYKAALGALGHALQSESVASWNAAWPTQRLCAFGPPGRYVFWVIEVREPVSPRHLAFAAADRAAVDAFHGAALAAGGRDHGAPGPRPQYHPNYYGAFVLDPDGNNVEAVCHRPAVERGAAIQVRGLDHIVLRVVDVGRMIGFYRDVLGCPVERRVDAIGLVQLRAGDSLLDLVPVDGRLGRAGGAAPGAEGRNLDHFCLRLERFDEAAIRAQLRAHGVPVGESASRYGAGGVGLSLYVTDPEGNVVELKGPAAG